MLLHAVQGYREFHKAPPGLIKCTFFQKEILAEIPACESILRQICDLDGWYRLAQTGIFKEEGFSLPIRHLIRISGDTVIPEKPGYASPSGTNFPLSDPAEEGPDLPLTTFQFPWVQRLTSEALHYALFPGRHFSLLPLQIWFFYVLISNLISNTYLYSHPHLLCNWPYWKIMTALEYGHLNWRR